MGLNWNKLKILGLFIIASMADCRAQQPSADSSRLKSSHPLKSRLDSLVQQAAEHYMQSPASFDLSVGVITGKQADQYHFHRGKGPLPGGNTFYGLGSIAKTFAGLMLAEAVVEQKIRLEDDIRNYLPGSYPNLEYQGHPVHVADLANHTSAMPDLSRNYTEKYLDSISKLKPGAFRKFYSIYTADSLLKDMHHFKLDTIPGTKYHYNGNAVMVLITILQQVYHQPYKDLVTSYLKAHCHMLHTKPELSPAEEKQLLTGHDEQGNPLPFIPDYGFRGAPTMFSTPVDMLKYAKANLQAIDPAIKLSHEQTFKKPGGMILGLNWMMGKEDNGLRFVMHTGHDGFGFTSLCYIYPDIGTAIVILANDSTGEDSLSELKDRIVNGFIHP